MWGKIKALWRKTRGSKRIYGGYIVVAGKVVAIFDPALGAQIVDLGLYVIGIGAADAALVATQEAMKRRQTAKEKVPAAEPSTKENGQ